MSIGINMNTILMMMMMIMMIMMVMVVMVVMVVMMMMMSVWSKLLIFTRGTRTAPVCVSTLQLLFPYHHPRHLRHHHCLRHHGHCHRHFVNWKRRWGKLEQVLLHNWTNLSGGRTQSHQLVEHTSLPSSSSECCFYIWKVSDSNWIKSFVFNKSFWMKQEYIFLWYLLNEWKSGAFHML